MVSRVNVVPVVPAVALVPCASWPVFVTLVYRIFAEMWLVGVGGRVMIRGNMLVHVRYGKSIDNYVILYDRSRYISTGDYNIIQTGL